MGGTSAGTAGAPHAVASMDVGGGRRGEIGSGQGATLARGEGRAFAVRKARPSTERPRVAGAMTSLPSSCQASQAVATSVAASALPSQRGPGRGGARAGDEPECEGSALIASLIRRH